MPAKKNKQSRRRRTRGGEPSALTATPDFFPRKTVKMAYAVKYNLTEGAAGQGTAYALSLNGLYDPDITSVGAQPVTFDQISAMYQLLRVSHVDVDVFIACTNSGGGIPCVVGTAINWVNALPNNPVTWAALPMSRSKMLVSGGYPTVANFKFGVKPWKVLGISRVQYMTDLEYASRPTGNPSSQAYLNVWQYGTTQVASTYIEVRLVYTVEVSLPQPLSFS